MNATSQPTIYPSRVIGPDVDSELAMRLNDGLIVLIGRNSSSGPGARDLAAHDLHGAAQELAARGIDIRSELPSTSEICADLSSAKVRKVPRFEGVGTVNLQWVIYDRRATAGVVAVVCAGSSTQASDDGTQPWIELVNRVVAEHEPVLLFAKEIHRLSRVTWLAGPVIARLQLMGSWLGWAKGMEKVSNDTSLRLFVDLDRSAAQAKALPESTRRAMKARTEHEMVGGQAIIAFNHSLPAGLARVRLRSRSGRLPSLLYLDGPRFRPDPSDVASGLSEAADVEGQPADQVAALQHLFATAFMPGWIRMDGVRELRRRGFSTDKLRGMNDLDATLRSRSDSIALGCLRSIWRRLDFYESGELVCPVGLDGFEPIVIRGCMPPEGWASPEDFARIRAGLRAGKESRRHFRLSLTGLPVEVDGKSCVLRSRPLAAERDAVDTRPTYNAMSTDRSVRSPRVSIAHEELAQFYSDGIAAAFDTAVRLFDSGRAASSPSLDRLWSRRDDAERERVELAQQCAAVLDRVATATGPLSLALESRYNDELHPALTVAALAVAELDREIAAERDRLSAETRPLAADQLLHLVSTLDDANSGEFRELLLGATRDVTLRRRRTKRRDATSFDFELTGVLRVHVDDEVADIPLRHTWSTGALKMADERATELLRLVRSGVPLHRTRVTGKSAAVVALAQQLKTEPKDLLLSRIRDGRIARAVLELIYLRDERSNAELAAALSEPIEFIDRLEELYADPPARWLFQDSNYLTALYASAACNDGVALLVDVARWAGDKRARLSVVVRDHGHGLELVRGVGYRVPPCRFCGCLRLVPLRIHEPVGPVCSSCRKDRRGLLWPADPYDAYVSSPGVWLMADIPGAPTLSPNRQSRTMW